MNNRFKKESNSVLPKKYQIILKEIKDEVRVSKRKAVTAVNIKYIVQFAKEYPDFNLANRRLAKFLGNVN